MFTTPTKRHHGMPTPPHTPDHDDHRGQMAKYISPELRAQLASTPKNVRHAVATGGHGSPLKRTPLGASISEPSINPFATGSPSSDIFQSGRDTFTQVYLGPHASTSSTGVSPRGLQPMCEITSADDPWLLPASKKATARMLQELDHQGAAKSLQEELGHVGNGQLPCPESPSLLRSDSDAHVGRWRKRESTDDESGDEVESIEPYDKGDCKMDSEDTGQMEWDIFGLPSGQKPICRLPVRKIGLKRGLGRTQSLPDPFEFSTTADF